MRCGCRTFARLPLTARVLDELVAMLNHADALPRELETEEASPLLWIEPHVRQVTCEEYVERNRFAVVPLRHVLRARPR
jgi:hypothetical protein